MATTIKKGKIAAIEIVSYLKKEDYKAITLKSDSQVYVEHVTLANKLIKKGMATEAKGVEFDVMGSAIKYIEDVEGAKVL